MNIANLLTARRNARRWHWTDIAAYAYLLLGVALMFGPVLWLVLSSFKTPASLLEFPPSLLPTSQKEINWRVYPHRCPLFKLPRGEGTVRNPPQARRAGTQPQITDPANPSQQFRIPIDKRVAVRQFALATQNYTEP